MWQCTAPPISREGWSFLYFFILAKKLHLALSCPIGIEKRCGKNLKFSRARGALLASSFIELQTDTTIQVRIQDHRSLVAYVRGLACSVSHLVLFRSPPSTNLLACANATSGSKISRTRLS